MTNYEKYFGTPEKAAKSIFIIRTYGVLAGCPFAHGYEGDFLEWLQEEAS